jgi:hypothetical protein
MKKTLTLVLILISGIIFVAWQPVLASAAGQSVSASISGQTDAPDSLNLVSDATSAAKEPSIGSELWSWTKGITILAFFAFAIVYIAITLLKKPRYKPITADEMRMKRREKGKAETSEADDQASLNQSDQAFLTWKVVSDPGEAERRSPTSMSQIKASHASLVAAIEYLPTSAEAIERINELGEVINNQEKRYFTGSMKLIYCGIAACVISYFMGDGFGMWLKHFWWLPVTVILYYFASMSPQFLNAKRERWFRGFNIHNVLIATVLGLFASTPATETWETTYSDGSSKKSEEINPFFIIMFVITIVVVLVLGFFTFIFAGLNFVRNYLIYA